MSFYCIVQAHRVQCFAGVQVPAAGRVQLMSVEAEMRSLPMYYIVSVCICISLVDVLMVHAIEKCLFSFWFLKIAIRNTIASHLRSSELRACSLFAIHVVNI